MSTAAIILAAGKGARMKTATPKVLHKVCNLPMLTYVLEACREAGCDRLICVIGFGAEEIRAAYADQKDIVWVLQEQQLGTGHAVQVSLPALADLEGEMLVLAGDGPLVRPETLSQMLSVHRRRHSACTLATSILNEPEAYGRIIRDETGELEGIVEYLDATAEQARIKEVNVSLYCFDTALLRQVVGQLRNDNAKGEYYLTDTLGMLRGRGHTITAVPAVPPEDVLSINDRVQLAQVSRLMQQRIQARLMLEGVTIENSASTWIDPRSRIGTDTVIRPMTVIDGLCRIGRRCTIGPMVVLKDAQVADGQSVEASRG
jgi:bifunctional UDP-N-acetylglucosamine pyrophosphorylase/glucosamine-1-phosphate N-acetyltransferase